MAERGNCSGCGIERPADVPFGLCPSCLLKAGLEGVTISFGPATSSVLASFGEAFGNIPPVLLRDPDTALHPSPVVRPSSEEMPAPGDRTARLQIFGEIARGGMGAVLKGRDADLGRELAVKVLLESHRDKPDMVRRFVEEAQIAGQLQHPGIVPVYELGALGDRRPYFAMKLVKGETLAEVLAGRKSPSEGLPRFLTILESICQTMAYAHARGVIHRDLKPSNVMVGSFGEVQVMDWGLAKVLPRGGVTDDASAGRTKGEATVIATARSGTDSDLSMAGSIMGTPSYMAPEQARGEIDQLDQRVDVFAIGSIFCEMLTGQPAFVGRNSGEIQRKAARGELTDALSRLDLMGPGCDQELIDLAKACLSPERDDRPRHAGEVAEKLADYHARVQSRLRQSEIERAEEHARAQEAVKRAAVERQRRRLTAALAASILGFVVLGGGGWAYFAQQHSARQTATEQAVNESLSKATLLHGQAKAAPVGDLTKWTEAIAAAQQAEAGLQTGEPSESLRQRVTELIQTLESEQTEAAKLASENEKDRKLFARIEAIRIQYVDADEVWYYDRNSKSPGLADAAYAEAFREFGVDVDQLEPAEAGRLLRQRTKFLEIAFAIDAWALIRKDLARVEDKRDRDPAKDQLFLRLVELTKIIDDDPWRCAIRGKIGTTKIVGTGSESLLLKSPKAPVNPTGSPSVLELLANEKKLAKQPARALYVLALILEHTRSNEFGKPRKYSQLTPTIALLKRAWQLNPSDFQICWTLSQQCPGEMDKHSFAMAAAAAAPNSEFARKTGASTSFQADEEFLLNQNEYVKKGEKPPEWKFPHIVIESPLGEKVYLGPTRFRPPTEAETAKRRQAVGDLRWAIKLNPTSVELRANLAGTLIRLGRYDEALAECAVIVKLDPKWQPVNVIWDELYGMGQLDRVKELIENHIKNNPKKHASDLHFILGAMHAELGNRDRSFEEFRSGIFFKYTDANGEVFWERDAASRVPMEYSGTPEQVIAAYQDFFADKQVGHYLAEEYALFLQKCGKMDKAVAVYREAMTRKDGEIHLYLLSKLLVEAKRPDEAIKLYREAIAKDPKSIDLRTSLAKLYGKIGKPAERIAELNEVVALYLDICNKNPESGYRQSLVFTYQALGKRDEARKQYRILLSRKNISPLTLNSDAMQFATSSEESLRDGELAVEAATRACALTGYANSMILDTLATAYAAKGDFDAAVKWQLKAIELIDESESAASRKELEDNLKLFREKKTVPPWK